MLLIALLAHPALAGERFLAWSYGADTVPLGTLELEPILTVETHHEGDVAVAEWTHEVELEYGITRRLEGGLYVVGSQTDGGPLSFAGYKARVRYRFWPLGTRPVDMAGYLEYVGTPTFDEHEIEAKLIVAHEGRELRASLNVTGELLLSDGGLEPVLEPTAGVAWRLDPYLALGAEGKMEMALGDEVEGPFFWLGPTLHLSGEDGVVWWTTSAIFGLTGPTRDDAEIEARTMLGIDL